MSQVYIAPLKDKTAFKIGRSNNPIDRILTLSYYYDFDYSDIMLIDCKTTSESFILENILHTICDNEREILNFDGGTEFFKYIIYDKTVEVCKNIVLLKNFTISSFPIIEDIKMNNIVKIDDVEKIIQSLCNKIHKKRLSCNITRPKLAQISNTTSYTIKNLENGRNISIKNLIRLMKALNMDYIFNELLIEDTIRQRCTNKNISRII